MNVIRGVFGKNPLLDIEKAFRNGGDRIEDEHEVSIGALADYLLGSNDVIIQKAYMGVDQRNRLIEINEAFHCGPITTEQKKIRKQIKIVCTNGEYSEQHELNKKTEDTLAECF